VIERVCICVLERVCVIERECVYDRDCVCDRDVCVRKRESV
jgi:hypothetical protein